MSDCLDTILGWCAGGLLVAAGIAMLLLAQGCAIFETPKLVNGLAVELRSTSSELERVTEKIEATIDDPEGFVDAAMAGAVKGGLRGLTEGLNKQAESLEATGEKVDKLFEEGKKEVKAAAGVVGSLMGLPPGPVSSGMDIGLGLLGLHTYRNRTRKDPAKNPAAKS